MHLEKGIDTDPSLLRDIAEAATSAERFDMLVAHVDRLSVDVHTLKGNLAANTSITKEAADGQQAIAALLGKIDIAKVVELISAVDSMRGGIKVLGWLERPAKWLAAVGGAVAIVYSIWEHK